MKSVDEKSKMRKGTREGCPAGYEITDPAGGENGPASETSEDHLGAAAKQPGSSRYEQMKRQEI